MSLSRFITPNFANVIISSHDQDSDHGLATREYVHEAITAAAAAQPSTPTPAPAPESAPPIIEPTAEGASGTPTDIVTADTLAGDGLVSRDGKLSLAPTLGDITVNGTATFRGGILVPNPSTGREAVNKAYADGLLRTAGQGLELNGTELSVSSTLSHVTSIGVLRSLHVQGTAAFSTTVTVRDPVDAGDATPKRYVDGLSSRTGGTIQYARPEEGETLLITGSRVILDPPNALTALTVTLPTGEHGRLVTLTSTRDIGTVTFTDGPGPFTLAPDVPKSIVYVTGPDAWFST